MKLYAALLLALLMSSQADAAPQRCTDAQGRAYWSDRACPIPGASTRLGVIAAPPDRYRPSSSWPSSSTPRAAQPEAHLAYLSGECASLYEAIRTGPARGVGSGIIGSLRQEYQRKCELADRDARSAAQRDAQNLRSAATAQRDAQLAAKAERQDQAQQCNAMRDSIGLRRKRERDGALNDKEVSALRSFEVSFNERCLAV